MAWTKPKQYTNGSVITASNFNDIVNGIEEAHAKIEPRPSLPQLAAVAAVAAASTKPLSRRALLGLGLKHK